MKNNYYSLVCLQVVLIHLFSVCSIQFIHLIWLNLPTFFEKTNVSTNYKYIRTKCVVEVGEYLMLECTSSQDSENNSFSVQHKFTFTYPVLLFLHKKEQTVAHISE